MPDKPEEDSSYSPEALLVQAQELLQSANALSESARAASTATIEAKNQLDAVLAEAQAKLGEITTLATQALAAKTQVTDEQAVIATKSDHIQKAQEHADNVRASLDRTLTAATQQATETEGQKNRAQTASDAVTELLTNVKTVKGKVETDAEAVAEALKLAEESADTAKVLADKATSIEERINAYETKLTKLQELCQSQLQTIEELLPGAAATGLAHAFDKRRKGFESPEKVWQGIFVGSVVLLVILALNGLLKVQSTETYGELFRVWLSRLPLAGGLVWLALYASRESALAKRLEEDYGYKVATAASFLGFHKQMSQINVAADPNSPLAKLCENTLTTIATPPGRIYDKHQLTVTPSEELVKTAKAVVDVAKAVKKP